MVIRLRYISAEELECAAINVVGQGGAPRKRSRQGETAHIETKDAGVMQTV